VTLSFPSGGVVARIEARAGDRVRRGQVLAVLDAAPARAQLDGARSTLEKADRDFQRAQALEGTALARQQREDATTGLQIARANVEAAEFAVRRSAIVAPADGVVISRFTDPNQTVAPGAPVLRLSTDSSWELEIAVPAADALRIEPGLPAAVHLAAYGDATFAGQVVRKAGGAGGLGTWLVTVALENPELPLASGLVGSADLRPTSPELPVVPLTALAEVDGSRGVVYTVADGVAKRVPVELAFFADDRVALASPLPADEVVDVGTAFVRDGVPVAVVSR
jgi:RND family efflux transporter MFP subunit